MSPELISILALVAGFLIATMASVNMGMVMLAIAFLVGATVGDLNTEEILVGFPSELFVVLVGVTFLFAIARANGTIDWLVERMVPMVGGRIILIPWVMFATAAVLTAIGAVSPAAVAMVAPIAMSLAAGYRINPLLMGVMVIHGAQAGSFSPVSVHGTIVNGVLGDSGLDTAPTALFLGSLAVNTLIAMVVFVAFGGLGLRAGRATPEERELVPVASGGGRSGGGGTDSAAAVANEPGAHQPGAHETGAQETGEGGKPALKLDAQRFFTLLGLASLVVATLGFDLDVGLVAVTVSVVLSIAFPTSARSAPKDVAWPVVLLICGVLTYVGVLEQMGTIDYASRSVAQVGIPILGALLLCYIGAIVSAFASSTALMGALIPLAVPFLVDGNIGVVGFVIALAVSLTVVDVSPFSTNGAIVVANASAFDKESLLRKLMIYCAVVVVLAPLLTWVGFVVIGG